MQPPKKKKDDSSQAELIDRFLSNQSKELKVQSERIQLEKQDQQLNYDFARESLNVQLIDRRERRAQVNGIFKNLINLAYLVLILLALFVFACFYTNNLGLLKVLLWEISKLLIPGLGGFILGFTEVAKLPT